MKGFVQWVLAQRYRSVVLAIFLVTVPLVSFVSTALMTLETLRRGGQHGLISAVVATIGASVLGIGCNNSGVNLVKRGPTYKNYIFFPD